MVAQASGLAMMTVLLASFSLLYKGVQVSADAAENNETAYVLMDALEQWLTESRSPVLKTDSLSLLIRKESDVGSAAIDDACGTPLQSPFDFARAGVAVVPAGNVSCLPSSSADESSTVLLIERRVPCGKNCGHAGFYAELWDCSSGHTRPKWRNGEEALVEEPAGENNIGSAGPRDTERVGNGRETCDAEP